MRPSHRVLVNTIAQYTRTFVNIILSLYTIRVTLSALGHEDYGIYNLVAGVVAMLSFVTNTMITTTQRFLSYNQGKKDDNQLKNMFGTSLIMHIVISIILSIILILLTSLLFNGILNIPEGKKETSIFLYYATIAILFISFVSSPYRALLISHENIVYVSIVDLIDVFLKVLIAFVLTILSSNRLELYGIMLLLLSIFNMMAFTVYSHVKYAECVPPRLKYYQKEYVKDFISFASWTIYGTGCVIMRHQFIAILLNRFIGTVINAAYGIGFQVSSCLTNFSNAIQNAINPQLMQAEGSGNREKMLWLSTILTKSAFGVVTAIGIPCIIFMESLIGWWLGTYPENTVVFCRMTVMALIADMMTTGLGPANQAVGRIGKYMLLVYTPKILTIFVAWMFLYCELNIIWVVISFVFFECLSAIIRILVSHQTCNLRVGDYMVNVCLRELETIVVYSIVVFCLMKAMVFKFAFIPVTLLSIVLFGAIFYIIGLTTKERDTVKTVIVTFSKR